MSLKTKGINNKNEKSDYFESNLLLIEENINKLSLLENEKEKKIFALKRKIKETQDKKNKFIGKTFKTIEDIDNLREVCKKSNEVELLEAIERTLQGFKNDLVKSGVESLQNIEDIINTIDNEEIIKEKKYSVQPELNLEFSARKKKKHIKIIPIAIILILGGSFISLLNPKSSSDEILDSSKEVIPNEESQTMDRVDDENLNSISMEIVNEGGKLVYKDVEGHIFTPVRYEDLGKFSKEERAAVQLSNNKWVFINKNGKICTEEYDDAKPFSDERAAVQLDNNNWVFIDKYGQVRTNKEEYKDVKAFSEGLAAVQLSNNKWVFIDKSGNQAIDEMYDDAQRFINGEAKVKLKGKFITIDKHGKPLDNNPQDKNTDSQNKEIEDSKIKNIQEVH